MARRWTSANDNKAAPSRLWASLKTALKMAVIAGGLAFPLLALRTENDFSGKLVLETRWPWMIAAIMGAFILSLAVSFTKFSWRMTPGRASPVASLAPDAPDKTRSVAAVDANLDANLDAKRSRANLWAAFGLGLLLAWPLLVLIFLGASGALKWIDNYGVQILIYVMLGWGLNIVVGLAGLLDLGYVAFYAVGAYTYALLATHYGASFWFCLPLAGVLAAFWGILLGFPVLRLRGDYLAIITLAFGEIIRIVLVNFSALTNGDAGISSIPRVTFFGLPFIAGEKGFAAFFALPFSPIYRIVFLYYLILALALLTNFVTLRLRRLPIGRAWEALREDEIACRSLGINTTITKLTAFSLGAMFGGFAGAFFAARQGFVSPSSFNFVESATILAIVVLGGRGSQMGVAIAAVAIIGGSELLRELDFLKAVFGPDFDPTQYRMLLVGLAMVVMMNFRPRGFVSTREPTVFLGKRQAIDGSFAREGHG